MSAGGIAVRASIIGEIGERIIIYLDNMGRIEGELVRTFQGGFALKLSASSYKREKIANQLTWLVNKDRLIKIEDRQQVMNCAAATCWTIFQQMTDKRFRTCCTMSSKTALAR